MSDLTYFAADGSYGAWDGLSFLADTSQWTEEDWDEIDAAGDFSRASVAYNIVMRYLNSAEPPF